MSDASRPGGWEILSELGRLVRTFVAANPGVRQVAFRFDEECGEIEATASLGLDALDDEGVGRSTTPAVELSEQCWDDDGLADLMPGLQQRISEFRTLRIVVDEPGQAGD